MIWFGSSAGVALANMFPEAKSAGRWLRHGWHVSVAYVIGFFVMLAVIGWHPDLPHKRSITTSVATSASPLRRPRWLDRDRFAAAATSSVTCRKAHQPPLAGRCAQRLKLRLSTRRAAVAGWRPPWVPQHCTKGDRPARRSTVRVTRGKPEASPSLVDGEIER